MMKLKIQNLLYRMVIVIVIVIVGAFTSCIEPPLHLPAEDVAIQVNTEVSAMEIIWQVDTEWKTEWYYGWDADDEVRWGSIDYPQPNNFEVRRYFLGSAPVAKHTAEGTDGFTIVGNTFRKQYMFGYYDMLIWSEIEPDDDAQHVEISEEDLDDTKATTTRSHKINLKVEEDDPGEVYLYHQPEIFYSAYPQAVHISDNLADYDYYNEQENVWVKHINCTLEPLVYIYLAQVIIYNNETGRVRGVSGDGALSGLAAGTHVNTGHTSDYDCIELLHTHLKKGLTVKGRTADIIGTKLTTFGLCGMKGLSEKNTRAEAYQGTHPDNKNYLYVEVQLSNGHYKTLRFDVSDQMQAKCRGGVLTIEIDANKINNGGIEDGESTLFDPVVEDYEDEEHDILI